MNFKKEVLKRVTIRKGDITREDVDVIVNAANPGLRGGGGVDGAIHRAAGPELLAECITLGGCRHGEARITGGYRLRARHVIHTPGPVYKDGRHGEKEILKSSYYNSMDLARENNFKSIAFPAISTGIYGYPLEEACRVALETVLGFMEETKYLIDVVFVLFDEENYSTYKRFIETMKSGGH